MAQDPSNLGVNGCDVFLLQNWEAESPLSRDEQMVQIFTRFLELPLAERQGYSEQLRFRGIQKAAQLSQAEQDVLTLARPYDERQPRALAWLRTYYGPGSDESLAAMVRFYEGYGTKKSVFSDEARYGSFGDDWERVFTRMPQLLEAPSNYEEDRAKVLEEAHEGERDAKEWAESEREEYERDPEHFFRGYHLASFVGVMHILDEDALGDQERAPEDRMVFTVWYDANGKTVRCTQMTTKEVAEYSSIINGPVIDDKSFWMEADFGEAYDEEDSEGDEEEEEGDGDEDKEDSE